ncbi:MAG: PilZ domain-containing protein [Deltaproteobacteria bacterium]|nr:PilZ domain-containing protein [Deltaproteobacteria bacterium]
MSQRTSSKGSRRASDRRQATRHPIEITLEVTVGREMLILATTNLSRLGTFLQRAIPYPVGTKVGLRVLLPDEAPPIVCSGEVANVPNAKSTGMGIKFTDIAEQDQQRIDIFARALV